MGWWIGCGLGLTRALVEVDVNVVVVVVSWYLLCNILAPSA